MPITDTYVVEYLLQATRSVPHSLVWRAKDVEGFVATIRGVQVDLAVIPTRGRSFLCLTLTDGEDTVFIQEPPRTAIFRVKYESEDHGRLAALMKDLSRAVARQIAERENHRESVVEITRQSMYRRLIGTEEMDLREATDVRQAYAHPKLNGASVHDSMITSAAYRNDH